MVVLPWANNRVQGAEDFDSNPGAGISDMYIQPLSLGWAKPLADVIAGYSLYVPTGRYEDGAANNTGLGQWGQEILIGTTVYLNERRSVHAATAATFDFFSEKEDSDTKVGNIMNLEGGVGADFLGGGLTARLVYFGVFKLTEDRFDSPVVSQLLRDKNRVWGLGPESRWRWRARGGRRSTASSPCATCGSSVRGQPQRAAYGIFSRRSRSSRFPSPRTLQDRRWIATRPSDPDAL
jgi:hypothetical protein